MYKEEEDFERWMKELSCYIIRDKISSSFNFLRTLGEGSFGKVFLAMRLNEPYELVAVKVLDCSRMKSQPQLLKQFLSEIEVHWVLESCDGMLGLQQIFEDSDLFYLVLDYQESGTLLNQIGKSGCLSEAQTKIVMEQLLLAVDYLHCRRVIHRDIKLENILINKIEEGGEIKTKIADFGLAALAPKTGKLFDRSGTPNYMAPEILKGEGYNEKVDIFSLGSVFFNLVTGHYLFQGSTYNEIILQNTLCYLEDHWVYLKGTSEHCQDLLKQMLREDPKKRPSA